MSGRDTKSYAGCGVHSDTRSPFPGDNGSGEESDSFAEHYRSWKQPGIPGLSMSRIFSESQEPSGNGNGRRSNGRC